MLTGIVLSLLALPGADAQIHSLRTNNLRLLYLDDAHAYVVPHLARCFENAMAFHHTMYGYDPTDVVTILMEDFNDYGHGGTSSMPWNSLDIGMEPFDYEYDTQPANERMNWLMNHELVHLLTTDQASSSDKTFRALFFGKVVPTADNPLSMIYSYFTNPRWYSPRWYHEGYAVFMETWLSGGIGRVLGSYDEMVFRSMVLDSSYFYDVVGLESEGTTVDFQVGQNSYLYGTRFVTYLADQYGPDKLRQWFNRTDGSERYFSSQFENVYGVPLNDEWQRWIRSEHDWQKANIDSIRVYPVTPYRDILHSALGSVSAAYFDSTDRRLYTAVNFPGQVAHIVSIDVDQGTVRTICDVPTPALYYVCSLAYDPSSRSVFFTTDNSRDMRDLNIVDVNTGRVRMLLKNDRAGDLAFDPADKSVWGVQHYNGYSTIVCFPRPYTEGWKDVLKLDYGKDIINLACSPDGKLLTGSYIEESGRQRLVVFSIDSLLNGEGTFNVLYEFENSAPEGFVFSADGRYLFGTSYYTGVSNVWRYDFANRKMDIVTNCESGFFRPVPITDDSLVVFRYSGKGLAPVLVAVHPLENVNPIKYFGQEVVDKYPVVTTWALKSPKRINIDSLTISKTDYSPSSEIRLASLYPMVEGFKDFAAYGLRASLADPLGLFGIDATLSYSTVSLLPAKERVHASMDVDYYPWKLSTTYNHADFYDLFGPTKTSRAGYSLAVQYNDLLIRDRPESMDYSIRVAGYGGLERLPDFQNIATTFDKFYTVSGNLAYSSLLRTLGAVEFEKGVKTGLYSYNTYVNARIFPRVYGILDYGFLLPLLHSSFWLRSAAGQSFGGRSDPFANFYFGGFGNNWVDHQEARRFREYYSFPGVQIDEIGGKNFGKLLAEWTLPPIHFRRFGMPGLYFNWSQLMLFTSGIVTNFDSNPDKRSFANAGAQLDFKLVMFSLLESTFSFGYAAAVQQDQRLSKEFMFSLKILK
ncbi:MAG TPA: hypothetical protein VI758_11475 [Bacteroidota bacterium]